MSRFQVSLLTGILTSFLFFSILNADDKTGLPEVTAASEGDDFIDLSFAIRSVAFDAAGNCTVHAYAKHAAKTLGLSVTFRNARTGIEIVYSSLGPESDALLRAMSSLYKVPMVKNKFTTSFTAKAFGLGSNLKDIRNKPIDFKAFFNDSDDKKYAELYTNVDLKKNLLELAEKDPGYRKNVLNAFSD